MYESVSSTLTFQDTANFPWPYNAGEPPLDMPVCGFAGERCILPGESVPLTGERCILPGESVPLAGERCILPGESVPLAG